MKEKIFKQFLEKRKKTKKWLTFPVSFLFHGLVISALIITPLITADSKMPSIKDVVIMAHIAPPLHLPLPRGRRGGPSNKPIKIDRESQEDQPKTDTSWKKILLAPKEIPDNIGFEKIPDPGLSNPWGVIGAPPQDSDEKIVHKLYALDNKMLITTPLRTIKQPKLITKVKPIYPSIALKARIQGDVVLEAMTDVYGRVVQTQIISGNPLLIKAAIDAVRKWLYEPYIICGYPKPVKFKVIIQFRLKN